MKTPAEAIIEWKNAPEALPRETLFRRLVEFDSWMLPLKEGVEGASFAPFEEGMLPLKTHEGMPVYVLCSCWDAWEAHGSPGYGDRGGSEFFGTEWRGAQGLLIDPGTPQELLLEREDLPKLKALAEAVALEEAFWRLRNGQQDANDLARMARYDSYHLGVAKRAEEEFCFCELVNDDGRTFIALFTHADAIALGWPEIAQRYEGQDAKQACVSGRQIFPTLANERTAGFVINCNGPSKPVACEREVFDWLLAELEKPVPEPAAPAPAPAGPPPLPPTEAARMVDPVVVDEVARLSNEGVRLGQTRRAEEAEALLRQALALAEEKLGADHPSTAASLSNLGDFLSKIGRLEEALDFLGRAVVARERIHGPDHAETGTALNNLALALRRMERFEEAEPLYRRVLAIFETAHGPESIEVAGLLNNYAQVLSHTGRTAEAEPQMRRVVELFEKYFGGNHPNVAIALNNLARLLEGTGRAREAEPFSRRHLGIFQTFENETGNEHAYKRSAMEGYGNLLTGLGWKVEDIRERIGKILRGEEVAALPAESSTAGAGDAAEPPDFDRLAAAANAAGAGMDAKNILFAAAFRLKDWNFIARGEIPDVRPYVAANQSIADGAPMLKAFTDTERLHAFAKENSLTDANGGVSILTMSVATLLPTMESYAESGITHIHFNANLDSNGFFVPLVQLPIIRRHLEKLGLL